MRRKKKRRAMGRRTRIQGRPVVFILGPQGSGKGTQAALLAEKQNLVHIETGKILRSFALKRKPTLFERRITTMINNGSLIPYSWVLKVLRDAITRVRANRGIVFDGSPRRLGEAKSLIHMLNHDFGRPVSLAILLTIPHKETVRRLSKRWVDVETGKPLIMGVDIHSPDDPSPIGSKGIKQRTDDKPEAIAKRLDHYHRETQPVIDHLQKQGLLVTIDGRRPIKTVFRDVHRVYLKAVRS